MKRVLSAIIIIFQITNISVFNNANYIFKRLILIKINAYKVVVKFYSLMKFLIFKPHNILKNVVNA